MAGCRGSLIASALSFFLFAGSAESADFWFSTPAGPFDVPVRSMQELKFTETIGQGFDFSCGSAALATLLTYHYGYEMSEFQVFKKMWDEGDKEKISKDGFSMLDMKRFLKGEGFDADGFRVETSKIRDLGVAGIVLLENLDSPHFVVVIGEQDGEILLSDPARGIWNVSESELAELWNGVFFLVRQQASLARSNFNDQEAWKRHRWAPISEERLLDPLMPVPIELPLASEFNLN